jgi:hypothetical protein
MYSGGYLVCQLLAGFVSAFSGVPKTDLGILPQRQNLFLAAEAVFEPPQLAAGWCDLQIETSTIE